MRNTSAASSARLRLQTLENTDMNTTEPTKHELLNEDTIFLGTAVEILEQMR